MTDQTAPGGDFPATGRTLARNRWPWPERPPPRSEDLFTVKILRGQQLACPSHGSRDHWCSRRVGHVVRTAQNTLDPGTEKFSHPRFLPPVARCRVTLHGSKDNS